MQEYNSPEEYIKDVQRYIRWSRAKVVATRELSDHINDQYDALRENGLNQKEAMRKMWRKRLSGVWISKESEPR